MLEITDPEVGHKGRPGIDADSPVELNVVVAAVRVGPFQGLTVVGVTGPAAIAHVVAGIVPAHRDDSGGLVHRDFRHELAARLAVLIGILSVAVAIFVISEIIVDDDRRRPGDGRVVVETRLIGIGFQVLQVVGGHEDDVRIPEFARRGVRRFVLADNCRSSRVVSFHSVDEIDVAVGPVRAAMVPGDRGRGIDAPWSCRDGVVGTDVSRRSGDIHRVPYRLRNRPAVPIQIGQTGRVDHDVDHRRAVNVGIFFLVDGDHRTQGTDSHVRKPAVIGTDDNPLLREGAGLNCKARTRDCDRTELQVIAVFPENPGGTVGAERAETGGNDRVSRPAQASCRIEVVDQ